VILGKAVRIRRVLVLDVLQIADGAAHRVAAAFGDAIADDRDAAGAEADRLVAADLRLRVTQENTASLLTTAPRA
jgi:hypothetical protein